jgi:hypothetical protein
MGKRRESNSHMVDSQFTALIHLATSAPYPAKDFLFFLFIIILFILEIGVQIDAGISIYILHISLFVLDLLPLFQFII